MIEWFVSDAKFDFCTYFFSTLTDKEIAPKINALSKQYEKYFEESGTEPSDLISSRAGGLAFSSSFQYDPKSKKLLIWNSEKENFVSDKSLLLDFLFCSDAPDLFASTKSVIEFGSPNHDFEEAPFQVSLYKNILNLDPKGIFYDGEDFFTVKEFLEELEVYDALDIFEEESVSTSLKKEQYSEPQLGDLIMSGWESVQNLPFKKTLFRDEVLSGKDSIKKIFEAVVRNPLIEDKAIQTQLTMSEKEFHELKVEISQMINHVLADDSDS